MMKGYRKLVFFAAVVCSLGVLSGCRQGEQGESAELLAEGGYITFDTEAAASKGLDKNQFVKWDALELYALECATWDDTQDKWLFEGQELLKSSDAPTGNWSYAPLKRWPKSKVSFFAFYPSALLSGGLVSNVTNEAGSPTLDFRVPNDPVKQVDLLTAVHLDVTPSKSSVPLDFRHATARVTFSAIWAGGVADSALVRFNKLTLAGVYSAATLKLYDPAPAVRETGGWSGHKDPIDYTVTLDNEFSLKHTGIVPRRIVRDENTLFLIPQRLTHNRLLGGHTLLADYSYSIDKGTTWLSQVDTIALVDQTPFWEPGKHLNYVVRVTPREHFLSYTSPSATAPVSGADNFVTFTVRGSAGMVLYLFKTGGAANFLEPSPAMLTCNGQDQTVRVPMGVNASGAERQATFAAKVTNIGDGRLDMSGITVKQATATVSVDSPTATVPAPYLATSLNFTVTGTKGLVVAFERTEGDPAFSIPQELTCDGTAQTVTVQMTQNPGSARRAVYDLVVPTPNGRMPIFKGVAVNQRTNVRARGYVTVAGDETGLPAGMIAFSGGPFTTAQYYHTYDVATKVKWATANQKCQELGFWLPARADLPGIASLLTPLGTYWLNERDRGNSRPCAACGPGVPCTRVDIPLFDGGRYIIFDGHYQGELFQRYAARCVGTF